MSNAIQTQVRDVDETIREVMNLKDLVQQYTTLKQEETNLTYKEILKVDGSAVPEVRVPIEKLVFIDCGDELVRRLRLPCGYVTIKEAILRTEYGKPQITVLFYVRGEEKKIGIGLSPLYLIDLLYLHVLNVHAGILSTLKEAVEREVQSEARWVETLKELLAMVEIVLRQ